MNSDSPEHGAEDVANGTEQQPPLHSMSIPRPDRFDETVATDDEAGAESEPLENPPAATDANVEVDFGGPESTANGLSMVDHTSVPPIDSNLAKPLELPELSDLALSADMLRSAPEDASPTHIAAGQRSASSDYELSKPADISLDGIEQHTDTAPFDQLAFSIDAAMSPDSATESSARSASNDVVAPAVPFSSSEPSNSSFAYPQNHFSESTETISSPAIHPAGNFIQLAHAKSNVESHSPSVDVDGQAISELLRHNWNKGIPGIAHQSPGESARFRMPPLLLEVSRTDYQSRIEKIEEAAAAHLNRIIGERIEAAMDERDFMRAAEMCALLGY